MQNTLEFRFRYSLEYPLMITNRSRWKRMIVSQNSIFLGRSPMIENNHLPTNGEKEEKINRRAFSTSSPFLFLPSLIAMKNNQISIDPYHLSLYHISNNNTFQLNYRRKDIRSILLNNSILSRLISLFPTSIFQFSRMEDKVGKTEN